ncbi:hypothetical protein ACFFX0_07685 [Citricoccus parietis]|uniref:Uncharacterized protein n=1 Tax=Citricoccus parietis TaxID=592307 RepID=A0ABV5FWR1_9MICC
METAAATAISSIEVAWNPWSTKTCRAASSNCLRRSSRGNLDWRTGEVLTVMPFWNDPSGADGAGQSTGR